MKKTVFLCVTLIAFFCIVSCDKSIQREIYENEDGYNIGDISTEGLTVEKVEIYWTSGDVNITETNDGTISGKESGEKLNAKQKMHWKYENNTLTIRYCESGYSGIIPERYKTLNLGIPRNTTLSVDTAGADVKLGIMSCNNIDIKTVSGKISIESAESENISLKSASGEIKFNKAFVKNSLNAETTSGDIIINRAEAENIEINTVNGYTELGLYKCKAITAKSKSGYTLLRLCDGLGARIIHTTETGEFKTSKDYEYDGGFVFGDGSCFVNVDNESGTLKVE